LVFVRCKLMRRLAFYLNVSTILITLITSCSPNDEFVDQKVTDLDHMDLSWMTGVPCSAPCWYGLEPGKSQKTEAISILKELPFINADSMNEMDTWIRDFSQPENIAGQSVWFNCKEPADRHCVYLEFAEDTLFDFLITPNYEVTFKQAVERIGEPDGLSYVRANVEMKGCYVSIIWVKHQMTINHYEKRHTFGKDLCDRINEADNKMIPDLLIHDISYIQESWVNELWTRSNFKEWNGFIPDNQN
jgi:hypothetical protein